MFEKLEDALEYIESRRIKRTLPQFKATLKKYGFKHDYDNVVHITGTNGKGSTVKFLQLILNGHRCTVGTFTSPYLLKHNDRMAIDGVMIDDETLLDIINRILPVINDEGLSMFEIDILIALEWFKDKPLDYLVFEAGIGGRDDKTNIFESKVSSITNVALDHQEMLGDTVAKICQNKMGIIKADSVFVTTETKQELLEMMASYCHKINTRMVRVNPETIKVNSKVVDVAFEPRYQKANGALAVAIGAELIELDPDKVKMALSQFSLPLHFEKIDKFILDGSHNPAGVRALIESLQGYENIAIIMSSLDDKDTAGMDDLLGRYPLYHSSFPDFRQQNNKNENFVTTISKIYEKYDTIILTGSIHFVSFARNYLGGRFHGSSNN